MCYSHQASAAVPPELIIENGFQTTSNFKISRLASMLTLKLGVNKPQYKINVLFFSFSLNNLTKVFEDGVERAVVFFFVSLSTIWKKFVQQYRKFAGSTYWFCTVKFETLKVLM